MAVHPAESVESVWERTAKQEPPCRHLIRSWTGRTAEVVAVFGQDQECLHLRRYLGTTDIIESLHTGMPIPHGGPQWFRTPADLCHFPRNQDGGTIKTSF